MSADTPPRTTGTRRRMVAALTGLALLAGAGVLGWRAAGGADAGADAAGAASRPETDEQLAALCRQRYTEINPHLIGDPEQRFVARDGDYQARVYVSAADNWIIVCRDDPPGVRTFGTRMEPDAEDGIELFGAWDSVLKANLVIGRLPARTTTIRARLASGRVVTGSHDGEVFVIWAVDDSVLGARLTATGADGAVIAVAAAPAAT